MGVRPDASYTAASAAEPDASPISRPQSLKISRPRARAAEPGAVATAINPAQEQCKSKRAAHRGECAARSI